MPLNELLAVAALTFIATMACVFAWRRELNAPIGWLALAPAAIIAFALGLFSFGLDALPATACAATVVICLTICEVDRRHYLIPDVLVFALLAIAVIEPFALTRFEQSLGAILAGGLFLATREAFKRLRGAQALGLGDVKLAAAMGALLGPSTAFAAIAAAAGATALMLVVGRRTAPNVSHAPAGSAPFGVGLGAALAMSLVVQALR